MAPKAKGVRIPWLERPNDMPKVCPWLKVRTLRHWIATADENGLAPAIIRKGRVVLVDVDLFLLWLQDGRLSP